MVGDWLGLKFLGGDVEKGQLPGAVAYIVVQRAKMDADGDPVHLSNQCFGPNELEWKVTRRKRELDEILVKGRWAFREYESRTCEAIQRKHASKAAADKDTKRVEESGPDR